jgi:hypothetical protein
MKKVLFLTTLYLFGILANAQVKQPMSAYGYTIKKRLNVDSAFQLPRVSIGVLDAYMGYDTAQVYYNKVDSSIRVWSGSQWLVFSSGGGGTGSYNSNIGSGYRFAVPFTNNIKTFFAGLYLLADSTTNTNAITVKADSSAMAAYFLRRKDSVAGGYYPYSSNPLGFVTTRDRFGKSGEDATAGEGRFFNANGHNFQVYGSDNMYLNGDEMFLDAAPSGSGRTYMDVQGSQLTIYSRNSSSTQISQAFIQNDGIYFQPNAGNFVINDLPQTTDTSYYAVVNNSSGTTKRMPWSIVNNGGGYGANDSIIHWTDREIFLNKDSTYYAWFNTDSYGNYFDQILDLYLGQTMSDWVYPGSSCQDTWEAFAANQGFRGTVDMFLMMQGYNDAARGTNKKGGKEHVANIFKSIVANWFMQSWVAGNDAGITYAAGTWNTTYPDDSSSCKSQFLTGGGGHSKSTYDASATASYTFTNTNVVFGTTSVSGNNWFALDSFQVKIDGTVYPSNRASGWYNFDSTDYGVTDLGFAQIKNNKKGVACVVFQGLDAGSHTILITKGGSSTKRFAVDYFGHLGNPDTCKPIVITGVPYMPAASYATYMSSFGGTLNDNVIDQYNQAIEEAIREFQYYPISYFPINEYWRPTRDVGGDGVHPNGVGAFTIADAFAGRMRKIDYDIAGANPAGSAKSMQYKIDGTTFGGSDIVTDESNYILYTGAQDEAPLILNSHEDRTIEPVVKVEQAGTLKSTLNADGSFTMADKGSNRSTPASGFFDVFVKNDTLRGINDAGVVFTYGLASGGGGSSTVYPDIPKFRLTTESGVGVSLTDRTAQSTVYYTPWGGNTITLYTGSAWEVVQSAQVSIALSGLTSGKNYDVFAYNNSGTLTLELSAAWTDDNTRADAITLQDGVYVKSGATTRRYVGTIRTTGTTTTEDSGGGSTSQVGGKRFVWNMYNRVERVMEVKDETNSWTYKTQTWRQANGASGNKVEAVVGMNDVVWSADLTAGVYLNGNSSYTAVVAIGVSSTTTPSGKYALAYRGDGNISFHTLHCNYKKAPGLGYFYLSWMEIGADGGTCDFFGDDGGVIQSGMNVTIQN